MPINCVLGHKPQHGYLATPMTWSIRLVRHSLHPSFRSPSTEVSYAAGGKLRRIQRSLRSFRVFQDPDATLRGVKRDHVQSLPHHAEGTRKDLVQQANAQLH